MAVFPHTVRAPPEEVWRALTDPSARRGDGAYFLEAGVEKGRGGTIGSVMVFRTKRRAWREVLLEAERPQRLLCEIHYGDAGKMLGSMEWRLQPISLGTLLVLDVKGRNFWEAVVNHYVRKYFWRRLVREVKRSVEPPPVSVLDAPAAAPDGASEAAAPTDGPEAPVAEPSAPRKAKARPAEKKKGKK